VSISSNPEARLYSLVAQQRYEEAEILFNNRRTNGCIYLAGFAVECILKSLILANTTDRQRPKVVIALKVKYGHALDALRKEAARRGIHKQRSVLEEFRRLNTWNNNLRYSPGIQSMEDAQTLLNAVASVIQWASRAVRNTNE
jgi:HEPN domain-containing protein